MQSKTLGYIFIFHVNTRHETRNSSEILNADEMNDENSRKKSLPSLYSTKLKYCNKIWTESFEIVCL